MRTKTKTRVFSPLPKCQNWQPLLAVHKNLHKECWFPKEHKDPWSTEDLTNTSSEYGLTKILTIESLLRTKPEWK